MLFIISILAVALFIALFSKQIKKYAVLFYFGSALIAILFIIYSKMKLNVYVPENINKYVINIFSRSAVSTAMFTIVMYTGALDKKMNMTKKLFSIRGELSIIACILTLGHNILYGISIFPTLFTNPSSFALPRLIAAILSVTMICMMIPLMITSFKCVRKKIPFKKWKAVQRMAYVFYGLIYVHVMCLYLPKIQKGKYYEILIYSCIFILYYILRIHRFIKDKKDRESRAQAI